MLWCTPKSQNQTKHSLIDSPCIHFTEVRLSFVLNPDKRAHTPQYEARMICDGVTCCLHAFSALCGKLTNPRHCCTVLLFHYIGDHLAKPFIIPPKTQWIYTLVKNVLRFAWSFKIIILLSSNRNKFHWDTIVRNFISKSKITVCPSFDRDALALSFSR